MGGSAALRVMVVSNSLHHGGAERFASRLVWGLDRSLVRPRVVLLRNEVLYTVPAQVPVEALGYRGFGDLPRSMARLRRRLKRNPPDVILGTGTAVNTLIGFALAGLNKRPAWIARVDTLRKELWLRQGVLGLLYPLSAAVVANSAGLARALVQRYPRQKLNIFTIFNPVDFKEIDHLALQPPPWRHRKNVPLLVTAGRAIGAKRWDLLLAAFAKLIQTTPAELALCGDGPLLSRLRQKAARLGLAPHVHFLGHCANPFSILSQADLFVMTSAAEGLPNALIEAQGMGLCAVATRCDFGPEEIVSHGRTGLLVDPLSVDRTAAAMKTLLEDEPLRKWMGAAAREMARQRFGFDRRCRQWQEMIFRCAAI